MDIGPNHSKANRLKVEVETKPTVTFNVTVASVEQADKRANRQAECQIDLDNRVGGW